MSLVERSAAINEICHVTWRT